MNNLFAMEMVKCEMCNIFYTKKFWRSHQSSIAHKTALFKNEESNNSSPKYGKIIRKINNHICYDIIFPSFRTYLDEIKKNNLDREMCLIANEIENQFNSQQGNGIPSTSAVNQIHRKRPLPPLIPLSSLNTNTPIEKLDMNEISRQLGRKLRKTTFATLGDEEQYGASMLRIREYLLFYKEGIIFRLEEALHKHKYLKVTLLLHLMLIKFIDGGNDKQFTPAAIRASSDQPLFLLQDLDSWFLNIVNNLETKFEELSLVAHSNWTLFEITLLEIEINKYIPHSPGSFIELDNFLKARKATINVQNIDELCFKYAICSKLIEKDRNAFRATKYTPQILKSFNFSGISFPTPLSEIIKFEKQNNASINVYGVEREVKGSTPFIYPLRISTNYDAPKNLTWDLLYLEDLKQLVIPGVDNFQNAPYLNCHYIYIKNLSRLLSKDLNEHAHKVHICRRCLKKFYNETKLNIHLEHCSLFKPVLYSMPTEETNKLVYPINKLKYKQFVPYVIYADLETCLCPMDTCTPSPDKSYTMMKQLHEPSSYCYYVVCRNPADKKVYTPQLYRGPNAIKKFWFNIEKEVKNINNIYHDIKPISINIEELESHHGNICHICGKEIPVGERVLDHDHLTGKFRGFAHNSCNLEYTLPTFVPIIFHNGSRYDFKLIISQVVGDEPAKVKLDSRMQEAKQRKNVEKKQKRVEKRPSKCSTSYFIIDEAEDSNYDYDTEDELKEGCEEHTNDIEHTWKPRQVHDIIRIIATSSENMVSFQKTIVRQPTFMSARFLDSFRFMAQSLSKLVSYLPDEDFNHIRKEYPETEKYLLAKQKGVFPYEYISDLSKYDDQILPKRENFYSHILGDTISVEEYARALKFWDTFKCKTLGDYSDHYLKIDVLLLADVFENFRQVCHRIYEIDPLWTYTSPGLSYNSFLKTLKYDVELLTDYDMYQFFEQGIRGGLCVASKREIKVNNKYTPDYKPEEQTNYLFFTDCINLYGASQMEKHPCGKFSWVTESEIEKFTEKFILNLDNNASYGYVFEVSLEYSQSLHNSHSDFPLCPEKIVTPHSGSVQKLLATLHDKEKYICHYRYLKCVLKHGLRLKKVHRAIIFKQENWLKDYVELNTHHRRLAQQKKNEFEVQFFKTQINSLYGKMLEAVRGRKEWKMSNNLESILRYISKTNFKRRVILNEKSNLCMLELEKTKIIFDKPIFCGLSILDISKTIMADFHYNCMVPLFSQKKGDKIQLAYHDTDSFIYDITVPKDDDLYLRLEGKKEYFDFSNYPPSHPLYSTENMKVPGKFSDELAGNIGLSFIALRPKLYALKYQELNYKKVIKKKAKGIKREVVQRHLTYEMFENILKKKVTEYSDGMKQYITQYNFTSKQAKIYTMEQRKLALSGNDDKRYICENGVDTLPWGHYAIPLDFHTNIAHVIGEVKHLELVLYK